jgi:hypothetical protein
MTKSFHGISGALGLLITAAFWTSTTIAELFASRSAVIFVKTAIPWGFLLLIPCLPQLEALG